MIAPENGRVPLPLGISFFDFDRIIRFLKEKTLQGRKIRRMKKNSSLLQERYNKKVKKNEDYA
ncbi:MAG: hypothetical protein Q8P88_02820 [Candidatus Jorgensenbacteria bacterium]|nr:hypothetical protein [Candidatus Jorgensenbacteria bacterium]